MYDRKSYNGLRAKYGASYLPNVFDMMKVRTKTEEDPNNRSWLAGFYGGSGASGLLVA